MKHLPLWMARWKREGLEWFAKDSGMFEDFLSDVKERTVSVSLCLFPNRLTYSCVAP